MIVRQPCSQCVSRTEPSICNVCVQRVFADGTGNHKSMFDPEPDFDEARIDIIGTNGNDGLHYEQVNDGSTANYYELPDGASELQDIIAYLNCNAQLGEIGRAWMRYGRCAHSPRRRDLKKIIFYAQAELDRLDKYEPEDSDER